MKKEKTKKETTEDIVYEEDQGAALVKKLRAKLKKCEQEKKEYLDGWQRLKADTVNARKNQKQSFELSQKRIAQKFFQELLPALDSFDIATQGDAWEALDVVWKQGIEYVHVQLLTSLENSGVEHYGMVGDTFDPALHEAGGHAEGGESNTLARVERRGYKMGNTVIRPAQVVVYN
mgnify:CR=1 FL=1|tara:strand:- start:638 stop:1165 length:528 start_codon:yes stop_codon:yes gene_type:complete